MKAPKANAPSALLAMMSTLQLAMRKVATSELSPPHMLAFLTVATAKAPAVPTKVVADALGVSGARVSQILGRLGAGWDDDYGYGLIEYRRNRRRGDRSGKFVMLSPAGVALAAKLEADLRGQ